MQKKTLNKEQLNIVIAGASGTDIINGGDGFHALPKLLSSTNTHFRIDLVGNETNKMICNTPFKLNKKVNSGNVSVRVFNELIGTYIEKKGIPDILILTHPGFEIYAKSWLSQDEGVLRCLNSESAIVLGCSYGIDESSLDNIHAQAYGYKLVNITENPFCLDHANGPDNHIRAVKEGAMDWGRHIWVLEKGNGNVDEELLELLEIRQRLLQDLLVMYEDPTSILFDMLHVTENNEHVIHIRGNVGFVYEDKVLVNMVSGEIINDDVELDVTYIDPENKLSPTNVTLIAATIYRDYKENFI